MRWGVGSLIRAGFGAAAGVSLGGLRCRPRLQSVVDVFDGDVGEDTVVGKKAPRYGSSCEE